MFDGLNSLFVSTLNWLNSWVGNYGWAVVIFSLLIRLIVLPLNYKSRKGMRATMRVQPKITALQKKYANDKDKLNQKMMELYKKEGVSPMSGCLPLLLQYPILLLMFNAMRVVANEHTIQMILDMMNGQEIVLQGWLWIKNVFQPDSFASTVLPAAGAQLMEISKVGYSSILTQENIDLARNFLASPEYAAIAAEYGANQFMQLKLNLIFFAPTITLPMSFQALMQYANGLFILPLLAGLSQFFMTKVMNNGPKQSPEEKAAAAQTQQQNPANGAFMKWFFPIFSIWICATSNSAFSIYWMAVNVISIVENVVMNKMFEAMEAKENLAKPE